MFFKPLFKSESIEDKYNLIVFDTSWVAYAALLAKAYNWMSFDNKPSGHIYGAMSKILAMFSAYGGDLNSTELIFALDEYPEDTYALYPEYKGYRVKNFDPVPDIKELIQLFNNYTANANKTEADHVIASIAKKYHSTHKVTVVSADRDLWQILDLNNITITSRTKDSLNVEAMEQKFGICKPKCLALAKAIFGDPSDNIPKLPGRLSHKIINRYIDESDGSPENFYEILKEAEMASSLKEILIDGKSQVELMFKITKIKLDVDFELTKNVVASKDELLKYLHGFGINKFDTRINCLFY